MPKFPMPEMLQYLAQQAELNKELLLWLKSQGGSIPEEIMGTLMLTELRREEFVAALGRFQEEGGE